MKKFISLLSTFTIASTSSFAATTIDKIVDTSEHTFDVQASYSHSGAGRSLARAFTFGLVGNRSESDIQAEKKTEKKGLLRQVAEHAERKGCAYIAKDSLRGTQRERNAKWQRAETAEVQDKPSGAWEKRYMVQLEGKVYELAGSVESSIFDGTYTYICMQTKPPHELEPTTFATPAELK